MSGPEPSERSAQPTSSSDASKVRPCFDPALETGALVAGVEWPRIEGLVRQQQRNREIHTPPISLFRWWARRPHALIGGILDAAVAGEAIDPVISDPFSGGGTVALEAARRGLTTYAQDIHPWAIGGLRSALEEVDADELAAAARELLEQLDGDRRRLYGTTCPHHGTDSEVITSLWVRKVECPGCSSDVFLYPYSYISRASRTSDERYGWWGCSACGGVTRSSLAARERKCGTCRRRLGTADTALLTGRKARCRNTACRLTFDALERQAAWVLALSQRSCMIDGRSLVHLDAPTPSESLQADHAVTPPAQLEEAIPDGLETAVLRRAGLTTWAALYAPRQLDTLTKAAHVIDGMTYRVQVRNRLRLAVCGAGEMAGRVSRWDRHYPKAYEAVANHRFAVTGLSAEVNLLADRGRGVLKRRLAASVTAARWRSEHVPSNVRLRRRAATGARVELDGVLTAHGSSSRQLPRDATVDLVLTDPPYFDDVQYAELAALFLLWSRATGLVAESVELDLAAEAVANTRRGTDVERYRELLTGILRETHRTIKPSGRMILTFHNTDLRAWWALGRALRESAFGIQALVVAWAENDVDHSKRGRLSFTRDLVIECRPDTHNAQPLVIAPETTDDETRELLSAGRAIAAMPVDESLADFRARYRQLRGRVAEARISPTEQPAWARV